MDVLCVSRFVLCMWCVCAYMCYSICCVFVMYVLCVVHDCVVYVLFICVWCLCMLFVFVYMLRMMCYVSLDENKTDHFPMDQGAVEFVPGASISEQKELEYTQQTTFHDSLKVCVIHNVLTD